MRLLLPLLAFAASSCSDESRELSTSRKGEPSIVLVPGDGAVSSTAIVAGTGIDPSSMHLDSVDTHRPVPAQPPVGRDRRPVDVTLRSSPPGARVAVDGTALGVTPAFWNGFADGREHEFVFTLPGHAIARYRFVPVSSGVIHARLDPIALERDAGIGPPPEVVPHPPSSAIVPPAAPPTIATPDAGVPGASPAAPTSRSPATGPQP